jgi:hypothetical protein
MTTPLWLHILSLANLTLGIGCAVWLVADERQRPQPMWILNLVWPLVALSGGPLAVWLYRRVNAYEHGNAPFGLMTASATCHCGAGCTLGDLIAETAAFAAPGILVWFGLGGLFGEKIFAAWVLDFVLAFLLGILFQYFTIAPMRKLGLAAGLIAALKADTLSLTAWQLGMYGVMAIGQFGLAQPLLGAPLDVGRPEFWFLMQIAMLAGFAASYPVNWGLLKTGLKEKM